LLRYERSTEARSGCRRASWLKKNRFRVRREESSISAEKGYSRETGNLLFHLSLIVILFAVAAGGIVWKQGRSDPRMSAIALLILPTSYDNLTFAKFQKEAIWCRSRSVSWTSKQSTDIETNAPTDYTLKVAALESNRQ
jgi:cytochrome c biogenesis protein